MMNKRNVMFECDVMCVIIVVITSLAAFFFYDIATALYLRNVIAFLPTVRFFSNIHSFFEFHYFLNRIFVSLSYDPSIRLPSTKIRLYRRPTFPHFPHFAILSYICPTFWQFVPLSYIFDEISQILFFSGYI